MPIDSLTMDVDQRKNGGVWATFLCTDGKGQVWQRSRAKFDDEAAAQMALDAHNWTPQLERKEENDAIRSIREGTDPDAIVLTELRAADFKTRMVTRFMNTLYEADRAFMDNMSDWVAGFTLAELETILGLPTARAQTVKDRAVHVRDTIAPALITDDARVG